MSTTQTPVKERPILFSGAMVRALLDGSKTQTRRAIKPQPTQPRQAGYILHATDKSREGGFQWSDADCKNLSEPVHCPYGQPGERLWVRETLSETSCGSYLYAADGAHVPEKAYSHPIFQNEKKAIVSIHMPRVASRLLLEVVTVRVERLQAISEVDAKAEGVEVPADTILKHAAVLRYKALWASINGPESWDANPWVWVVEFKVIEPTA